MKRNNKKENKNNQEIFLKKRFVRARKINAMKQWEFISTNKMFHPTNKTHNGFHQTNALVGVRSF
jgi:hypothetical protein